MRRLRWLGLVAAAVLLAAACGDDNDTEEAPSPPEEDPTTVTVSLVDFDIELSETSLTAGAYTFVVEQDGRSPHALAIEGPGVSEVSSTIPAGGPSEELMVTLEPGTYELWCPVGNHRALGMVLTIEVS
jgi:plastocyanin